MDPCALKLHGNLSFLELLRNAYTGEEPVWIKDENGYHAEGMESVEQNGQR